MSDAAESGEDTGLPVWFTTHAAERWDERTLVDAVAPETAWRDAINVSGERVPWYSDGRRARIREHFPDIDEIRYHGPTDMVLLCDGLEVCTVIDASEDYRFKSVRERYGGPR